MVADEVIDEPVVARKERGDKPVPTEEIVVSRTALSTSEG